MKSLLINASILSDKNTGLGVYTEQVIKNVCPLLLKENITFDILCGDEVFLPREYRQFARIIKCRNFISRNINSLNAYSRDYGLVWSTTQHGGVFSKTKQIITIHDTVPLKFPQGRAHQAIYYKYIIPLIIKKAVGVIVVSDSTKRDVLSYYNNNITNSELIQVIPSIYESDMHFQPFDTIQQKFELYNNRYYSIIGIHYKFKNIHTVINAFSHERRLKPYKLVIIGNDNNKYGNYLHKLVRSLKLENKVYFTGFLTDIEKNTILANSIACIHPSLYEGFGYPLLEAMQAKVPAISSNTSSLPEVGGDAAIYFNPTSEQELVSAMLKCAYNKKFREEQIKKGLENIKRFNGTVIAMSLFNYICKYIDKV